MWSFSKLTEEEKLRVRFILDMGLSWSGMIRVFDEGSKETLHHRILSDFAPKLFNAELREQYIKFHTDFCEWGTKNILQNKRFGKQKASYGQIAKTLDVTLKVAVYYCHLPDCKKSEKTCGWLNAAVDTAMMYELKKKYPDAISAWPTKIRDVDKEKYFKIQDLVRESIKQEHKAITSPQWEDIHWVEANE
jgi:hypothetical protein